MDGARSTLIAFRVLTGDESRREVTVVVGEKRLTVHWAPHCSYCGRGAPMEVAHTHGQCPFLGLQNKHRAQAGVRPLAWNVDDGTIVRDDSERIDDVMEKVRKLEQRLDKHEARLAKLEAASGGGKRKADASPSAGSSSTPPAKKSKQAKGSGGGSGQASGSGGKPSPKGKAKGKKASK